MHQLLADFVLVLHAAVVLFVLGGLLLILVGNAAHWNWVNSISFRAAHILAIAVVMLQAWVGVVCPLTTLESWLRVQGGLSGYTTSFVEHWVQRLLFYEAPTWVFTLSYSAFAAVVCFAWWRYPPTRGQIANGENPTLAASPRTKTKPQSSSASSEA